MVEKPPILQLTESCILCYNGLQKEMYRGVVIVYVRLSSCFLQAPRAGFGMDIVEVEYEDESKQKSIAVQ